MQHRPSLPFRRDHSAGASLARKTRSRRVGAPRPRSTGRRRRSPSGVVAALAAAAGLAAALSGCGVGRAGGAAGPHPGTPVSVRAGRGTTDPSTGPPATSPRATTTSTTVPTAARPYRVLEIGDSLGVDLGMQLQRLWRAGGAVQVSADAVGDSGLANTGFYDWPTTLAGELASTHPQLVVVLLGANDMQGMVVNGADVAYGTTAWDQAYAARVAQISAEVSGAGADLLWIGEPAMQTPQITAGMAHIDGIIAGVIADRPGAAYLDPNPALSPAGTFAPTGPTPATGVPTTLRTPDGVHLTPAGASLLALAAARAVAATWHVEIPITPKAGEPAG